MPQHKDSFPCWCDGCRERSIETIRNTCPNVLPGATCVDPDCTYCRIAAEEGFPKGD